jgi:hypothetical protein
VTPPALYLDENFGLTFGKVLASRGLDVVTAQAADRLGRSDREQLEFAAQHGRCLVTQNIAHFVVLHAQFIRSGTDHAGILLVEHHPNAAVMASKCVRRLANETGETVRSQLLFA